MVRLGEVNPPTYEAVISRIERGFGGDEFEDEYEEFNWRKSANKRKFDRELFERYGYMKDIILHPKFQHVKQYLEENADFNVFLGEPLLPTTTAVVILFLINKRVSGSILGLTALLIFNINPLYVCLAAFVFLLLALSTGKKTPKQFKPIRNLMQLKPVQKHGVQVNPITGCEPLPSSATQESLTTAVEYDHVLVGSDLGTLYTAALLAKNGHQCCVLQPSALGPQFEVNHSKCLKDGEPCRILTYFLHPHACLDSPRRSSLRRTHHECLRESDRAVPGNVSKLGHSR